MGSMTFITDAEGKDAKAAFNSAVSNMQWDRGHGGYTGTIAEKHEFVMIYDTIDEVMKRATAKENGYVIKYLQGALEYVPKTPNDRPTYHAIAHAIAEALIDLGDARIDDKWGPAGCIRLKATNKYVFFGRASS